MNRPDKFFLSRNVTGPIVTKLCNLLLILQIYLFCDKLQKSQSH